MSKFYLMAAAISEFSSGMLLRVASHATRLIQPICGAQVGGMWSTICVRTNIRCHFPKPKEVKRIRVHGWDKRMSTQEGKRILWRRILKGRHVLSH